MFLSCLWYLIILSIIWNELDWRRRCNRLINILTYSLLLVKLRIFYVPTTNILISWCNLTNIWLLLYNLPLISLCLLLFFLKFFLILLILLLDINLSLIVIFILIQWCLINKFIVLSRRYNSLWLDIWIIIISCRIIGLHLIFIII